MEIVIGVLGVVAGAFLGTITTYAATKSTMRLDLEYRHDQNLRDARLDHYRELFHLTERIPREWFAGEPTRLELRQFRERFHNWYFSESAGGMFLTQAAKDRYIALQNTLKAAADRAGAEAAPQPLTPTESLHIRMLASELRHQLAEDVGASHPPRTRWSRLGPTLPPPSGTPTP